MPEKDGNIAGGIGILGGTFDPIHLGHVEIAKAVQNHYALERVVFIPAHQNPLRPQNSTVATPESRMIMSILATLEEPDLFVDSIEIERGSRDSGPSYTIDTLKEFKSKFPDHPLVLIVGADNVLFHEWNDIETFPDLISRLVIVSRPGCDGERRSGIYRLDEITELLPICKNPISSTEIRNLLIINSEISDFIHPKVELFIRKYGLYLDKEN